MALLFIIGLFICPKLTIFLTIVFFIIGCLSGENEDSSYNDDVQYEEPSLADTLLGIGVIALGVSMINDAYKQELENQRIIEKDPMAKYRI